MHYLAEMDTFFPCGVYGYRLRKLVQGKTTGGASVLPTGKHILFHILPADEKLFSALNI